MGVVAGAVKQQVLWCVRLCRAPGAVGGVGQSQPVYVGIEAAVPNSESGDGSVKGTDGGVGPLVMP